MFISVFLAFTSVVLRAFTSVIDRHAYGLKKQDIFLGNFINNTAAFVVCLPLILVIPQEVVTFSRILDPSLISFSLSTQLCAYAFSYGFSHLSISQVNLSSKIGDFLIPYMLFLLGATVGLKDCVFAALISLSSFLAFPISKEKSKGATLAFIFITVSLLVQSAVGEQFFKKTGEFLLYEELLTGLIFLFWRSMICFGLWLALKPKSLSYRKTFFSFFKNWEQARFVILRALFTSGNQVTFILALSCGHRVLIWPILNSVSLFAVFFSSYFIKESPHRRELKGLCVIVGLSIFRLFF